MIIDLQAMFILALISFMLTLFLRFVLGEKKFLYYSTLTALLIVMPIAWYWGTIMSVTLSPAIAEEIKGMIFIIINSYVAEGLGHVLGRVAYKYVKK